MEVREYVEIGQTNEVHYAVEDEHTAIHVGSGASRVLATPWMIAFMERVSHRLLAQRLPAGYSSVGVVVNIRHLAPTPVGSQVRVRSQVIDISGARVTFQVECWDAQEKVGEGQHERFVIDEARFLRRVSGKRDA